MKTNLTDKNGKNYTINNDFSTQELTQLVSYAHTDQKVITQTSDAKRFSSLESAQKWFEKSEKIIFTLYQEISNELAGIIWFENLDLPAPFKKNNPGINWTFGIRIYQHHRGQGLSKPFMEACFAEFHTLRPTESVWLSTGVANTTAQKMRASGTNPQGFSLISTCCMSMIKIT